MIILILFTPPYSFSSGIFASTLILFAFWTVESLKMSPLEELTALFSLSAVRLEEAESALLGERIIGLRGSLFTINGSFLKFI